MIPASPLTRPSARAVTAVPRTDGNSRVIRPVLGCQVYRARSGRLKGTLRRSVRDVLRKTGRGTSDLKKHHSGSRRGKGDNLALKKIGLDFGGHYNKLCRRIKGFNPRARAGRDTFFVNCSK